LNPNRHTIDGRPIPGSETFDNHVAYVMNKIVLPFCDARQIDILTHSHGGRAILGYLSHSGCNTQSSKFLGKLHRLVFTDSYHTEKQVAYLPKLVQSLLEDPCRAVNFVPHSAPLASKVQSWVSQDNLFSAAEKGCLCLSAGVTDHASTNYAAMDAIFDFLETGSSETAQSPFLLRMESFTHREGIKTSPKHSNCDLWQEQAWHLTSDHVNCSDDFKMRKQGHLTRLKQRLQKAIVTCKSSSSVTELDALTEEMQGSSKSLHTESLVKEGADRHICKMSRFGLKLKHVRAYATQFEFPNVH